MPMLVKRWAGLQGGSAADLDNGLTDLGAALDEAGLPTEDLDGEGLRVILIGAFIQQHFSW